jgi:hypothetical protein
MLLFLLNIFYRNFLLFLSYVQVLSAIYVVDQSLTEKKMLTGQIKIETKIKSLLFSLQLKA